jgi:hypothetical protein
MNTATYILASEGWNIENFHAVNASNTSIAKFEIAKMHGIAPDDVSVLSVSSNDIPREEAQCSRGWGERCAHSHGKKCRCKCGGRNHGKAYGKSLYARKHDEDQAEIGISERHGASFTHSYRGYYTDGGKCDVEFIPGEVPTLIISQREDCNNTSVTNMIEYLAAELLERLYPEAFNGAPVRVIEHYPSQYDGMKHHLRAEDTWDEVTFASMKPEAVFMGGIQRKKLGRPQWKRVHEGKVYTSAAT